MIKCIGYEDQFEKIVSNFKSNKLHNSIIISGPKGIGKRLFINNLLANFLKIKLNNNLENHINLLNKNAHPNIKILSKIVDNKTNKIKNNITIDQVRNLKKFLNETSLYKNLFKVIVVDSADDFNINSANSFLKTLEEPKSNTFLFLISHKFSSLLPTIRSRCLNIRFNNHNFDNFSKILNISIDKIEDSYIKFLYNITNGSPGNAIDFLNEDIIDYFEETLNILNNDNNYNNSIIELADNISKLENENFKNYLLVMKSILILCIKIKLYNYQISILTSKMYENLLSISKKISLERINEKLDFLTNNDKELYTFNLDKKIFMIKLLNI